MSLLESCYFVFIILELNYNYIVMCDNLLKTSIHNYKIKFFICFSYRERLSVVSINYNSYGLWDVIGFKNPLNQISEYIQKRHLIK